jgi:hypothetical protein
MSHFMKKPCQHCPFRRDVKPFLHPERAWEIASVAENPYSSFPCHKTTEHDEDGDESFLVDRGSEKECAGMLTIRANELGEESLPEGFKPSFDLVYTDAYEMECTYEEAWESKADGTA